MNTNNDENIFTVKGPDPLTPEQKKAATIWTVILVSIGIVAVLIAAFLAMFLTANTVASSYRSASKVLLGSLLSESRKIEVPEIMNRRDVSQNIAKIETDFASRPRLENTLLASVVSPEYRSTEVLGAQYDVYGKELVATTKTLPQIATFAEQTEQITSEANAMLDALPKKITSLGARTTAGTIDAFAQRVQDVASPALIQEDKTRLAQMYTDLANDYRELALIKEQSKKDIAILKNIADVRQAIAEAQKIDYAGKVQRAYAELVQRGEDLKARL